MKIYDIDNLTREIAQDDLFDLFSPTFQMDTSIQYKVIPVEIEDESRIDLISKKVYSSTDYIDILLNYNDIDNPLNIMKDDIIKYPPIATTSDFRVEVKQTQEVRRRLTNPNKSTRKDPARQEYVEGNFAISPALAKEPRPQVRIENGEMVLGS